MLAQTPFLRNGAIKLERYVVPARLSVIAEIDKACPFIRYQSVVNPASFIPSSSSAFTLSSWVVSQ